MDSRSSLSHRVADEDVNLHRLSLFEEEQAREPIRQQKNGIHLVRAAIDNDAGKEVSSGVQEVS
jgi:hypothetical protein